MRPKVAVQVPAMAEPPDKFRETLQSIWNCPAKGMDVSYQAWITPVGGDPTPQIAEEEGFRYFEAPEGKLNARNTAHDYAVANGFDVIVTIDADSKPLNEEALERLVRPVYHGDYVAVNSTPKSSKKPTGGLSMPGMVIDAAAKVEDMIRPHMHGQASSFSARAWKIAGPFETGLDQRDIDSVRQEEEFNFYERLNEVGEVMKEPKAAFYNDPRRHYCKVPVLGNTAYCDRTGEVTFNPRDLR